MAFWCIVEHQAAIYAFAMEILYPLPSLSSPESAQESTITVLVNHVIAADSRMAFLDALKELLKTFEALPGAKGYKVFQEDAGTSIRITILQRFASWTDQEAWLNSEDFKRWKVAIAPLHPTLEHVRTYSGMEALFAAGQSPAAPPRWKMAIVLFLAVFPLSLALSHWFGKTLASIPPLIGALISSPVMVVFMTYIMVPVLTKIFSGWLQPSQKTTGSRATVPSAI